MSMQFIRAIKTNELRPGEHRGVYLADTPIVICNVDGAYYAALDLCTHADSPLSEGDLCGHRISCPRHGAQFDLRTGAAVSMPAVYPVQTFETKIEGEWVLVKVNLDE